MQLTGPAPSSFEVGWPVRQRQMWSYISDGIPLCCMLQTSKKEYVIFWTHSQMQNLLWEHVWNTMPSLLRIMSNASTTLTKTMIKLSKVHTYMLEDIALFWRGVKSRVVMGTPVAPMAPALINCFHFSHWYKPHVHTAMGSGEMNCYTVNLPWQMLTCSMCIGCLNLASYPGSFCTWKEERSLGTKLALTALNRLDLCR